MPAWILIESTSLSELAQAWIDFFHADVPTAPLVLFRICFGAIVSVWMFARLRHADLIYGFDGYAAHDRVAGGLGLIPYVWRVPRAASCMLLLGAVAGLGLMLGCFTPWCSGVVFVVTATLSARFTFPGTSWEFVLALLSLLLALSPAGTTMSVDAVIWPDDPPGWNYGWATRLMQLQLCLIYFLTGLRKLARGRKLWLRGEPVYNLHHGPQGRLFVGWIRAPAIYRMLSWYALAVELTFPWLVWWPATRYPVLLAIVLLHIGMELFLYIFPFQWIMLASLTLFVAPRDVDHLFRLFSCLV